jgi:homocysteine S-methyltransferase
MSLPLWSASAIWEHPEIIREIHEDYIDAGADIITTNTFRTDARTFRKAGLSEEDARNATFKAVELAREAISRTSPDRKIWIAGSLSPLEDCYHPELAPGFKTAYCEHKIKTSWLLQAGVDFILIETMNTFDEALAATRAALETSLPTAASFILKDKSHILNGDKIITAYEQLKPEGIEIFSINCTHHSIVTEFLNTYADKIDLPIMVYVNAGFFDFHKGWQGDSAFTPEQYASIAQTWIARGVRIIGGCCGTGPEFISHLVKIKSPE